VEKSISTSLSSFLKKEVAKIEPCSLNFSE